VEQIETEILGIHASAGVLTENRGAKQAELLVFTQRIGSLVTEKDFLGYALQVVKPALKKYDVLFESSEGDHFKIKKAFAACRLFDPFYLAKEQNVDTLNLLADGLKHFGDGYPMFVCEFSSPR
jgi:hypothetical protein